MSFWSRVYSNFLHDLSTAMFWRQSVVVVETKKGAPKSKKYGSFVKSSIPAAYQPSLTYAEEAILEPHVAIERQRLIDVAAEDEKLRLEANRVIEEQIKAVAERDRLLRVEQHKQRLIQTDMIRTDKLGYEKAANAIQRVTNPTNLWERRMLSQGESREESLMAFYHLGNCPQCGTPTAISKPTAKKSYTSQYCKVCDVDIVLEQEHRTGSVAVVILPHKEVAKGKIGKNKAKRLKRGDRMVTDETLSKFHRSTCVQCDGYMEVLTLDGGTRKKCRTCDFEARTVVDVHDRIIDLDVINEGQPQPRPLATGDMADMSKDDLDRWGEEMDEFFSI
jgi:hypothetical protein